MSWCEIAVALLALAAVGCNASPGPAPSDAGVGEGGCPIQPPSPGSACAAGKSCGPYTGPTHADCFPMCPRGCGGTPAPHAVALPTLAQCVDGQWTFEILPTAGDVCGPKPQCSCAGSGGSSGKGQAGASGRRASPDDAGLDGG